METKNIKTYSYLAEDIAKGTKKCVIKGKLKFEDYKHCLQTTKTENKVCQIEKNKVYVNSL